MNSDQKRLVLIHALLHAGAILLVSFLLRDSNQSQTVTMLLIGLWFSSSMLLFYPQRVLCELRWLKRKIGWEQDPPKE